MHKRAIAQHIKRYLKFGHPTWISDIYVRMVKELAVCAIKICISVVVKLYAVDFLSHGCVVNFYANNADKLALIINRGIVGYNTDIQVVGDVRRKPNGFPFMLGNSKPHQIRRIVYIVLCDIGNLVLLKTVSREVDVPEAFLFGGDARIDTIVICKNAFCPGSHHAKIISGTLHMLAQVFITDSFQIFFHEGSNSFNRILNTVEIIIKTLLPVFAQHKKELISLTTLSPSYEDRAQERGEQQSHKYHAEHCNCNSCS